MKCPFCSTFNTQVIDTRLSDDGLLVRRRRRCPQCDKRFNTNEITELRMPCVVKVNGERVDFSEEKLRTSFLRALHKRPVPAILIDEQVKNIIQHILISNLREIPSRQIGDYVMSSLSKLDQVAYVRYASIYRSFKDVSEFSDVIKEVQQQI